jgi:hypothetical protein
MQKSSSWSPDASETHKKKKKLWFDSLTVDVEEIVYKALDEACDKPISLSIEAHQTQHFAKLTDDYFQLRPILELAVFLNFNANAYHCIGKVFKKNDMHTYKSIKQLLCDGDQRFITSMDEIEEDQRIWFPRPKPEQKVDQLITVSTSNNNKKRQSTFVDDFNSMYSAYIPRDSVKPAKREKK